MRKRGSWIAVACVLCVAVLAYGYLRAASRAYVNLVIAHARAAPGDPGVRAEVTLRDNSGKSLAAGVTDERFGFTQFIHPQFGSCQEEEKAAATSIEGRAKWQECNARKLAWQAGWSASARMVDVRFDRCELRGVALRLRMRRDDWWLWWVPLPHIGGDPLTEFSAKLRVNTDPCDVRVADVYD
jgi:hypothetical protein